MEILSPWLILLISLFISSLLLVRLATNKLRHGAKLPPGPTPLPVIGSLFLLGDAPHRSLARLSKTYGPVMSLRLGQTTNIIISSPNAARQVLQKHDQFLSHRTVPAAVRTLGHHEASVVWSPPNDRWRSLRAILQTHLFTAQRLDANQGLRREKVQQLIEHLRRRAGQRVDVGRAALCTTINNISNSFFSVDLVNLDAESEQLEFRDLLWGAMEEAGSPNLADFFPLLQAFDPQGYRRRLTVILRKLHGILDEIIDRRLRERASDPSSSSPDFLDKLLDLHMQDNSRFDRPTLRALLVDTFVAGSETTSNSVEWAMAELLRNDSIMAKLRAELEAVIGRGRQMEEFDILKLPYLQAVIKETFRLHPSGPFLLPRKAEKSVEVDGYTVPRNSGILVNLWALSRDENTWKDPETFIPERFLESEIDYKGRHFQLLPFGSGRRMCPGLPFADRMLHLMLGSLVHSFEWGLPDGMKPHDIDLTEKFGVSFALASPVHAIPLPTSY